MSDASATGFTLSGSWRQQFDWAVVEWNRDNVFEHPALRNLPDGDLSGIRLSYEETRDELRPDGFDDLRFGRLVVSAGLGGVGRRRSNFTGFPLRGTPVEGEYVPATAKLELTGSPDRGDYVELSWLDQHANYRRGGRRHVGNGGGRTGGFHQRQAGRWSHGAWQRRDDQLTYTGAPGSNGNRIGVYGSVQGSGTEGWAPCVGDVFRRNLTDAMASGPGFRKSDRQGRSPSHHDERAQTALDLGGGFAVRQFQARRVRGPRQQVADIGNEARLPRCRPGSRRIEDDAPEVHYTGAWAEERGNYSGGSIRRTSGNGARVDVYLYCRGHAYSAAGNAVCERRRADQVQVDGSTLPPVNLSRPLEDVLIRCPLGRIRPEGRTTVSVTHDGVEWDGSVLRFLRIALSRRGTADRSTSYPAITLATDWDTLHSIAIAPERTAWLIDALGFKGRANHYAGAMWFYELWCPDNRYASATITFEGTPQFGGWTKVTIAGTEIAHQNYITDTAETIAKAFELLLSAGSSAVWARAEGPALTITARAMGAAGNAMTLSATTGSELFTATVSSPHLSGGRDGAWLTDLSSPPSVQSSGAGLEQELLSRDARIWHRGDRGFQHGTSAWRRRGRRRASHKDIPDGPVVLNTPAVQTNFGPASTRFLEADLSGDGGGHGRGGCRVRTCNLVKCSGGISQIAHGMPFYDEYTKSTFQADVWPSNADNRQRDRRPGAVCAGVCFPGRA